MRTGSEGQDLTEHERNTDRTARRGVSLHNSLCVCRASVRVRSCVRVMGVEMEAHVEVEAQSVQTRVSARLSQPRDELSLIIHVWWRPWLHLHASLPATQLT